MSCGQKDEKHTVIKHKGERAVPAPGAGRAMVVVVVGGAFYKSYQTKLAVNGEWRAVMNESQVHVLRRGSGSCDDSAGQPESGVRDDNFLVLTARAGETYYIRGTATKGITELDPAEGRKQVRKKTYVTFEVRDDD